MRIARVLAAIAAPFTPTTAQAMPDREWFAPSNTQDGTRSWLPHR